MSHIYYIGDWWAVRFLTWSNFASFFSSITKMKDFEGKMSNDIGFVDMF